MTKLIDSRLQSGIWHGEIAGPLPARLIATYLGRALDGLQIEPHDTGTTLRLPLPPEMISDGVQTCVIADADTGDVLASVTLVAGQMLAEDLRTEVTMLRAELDLVKAVLRRLGREAE
ncbi:hypothetical protein ACXN5S_00500 [Pseudoroseicyclus sp. H15]